MDLMDLLTKSGGDKSLGSLASGLGLDASKTSQLVSALAPALMRGVQKQAVAEGGLDVLKKALSSGSHQRYVDEPELMQSDATRDDGNKILGHLLGSKEVSRTVAAEAAASTGIDVGLIKKALPMVAGLAMGALSKSSNSGKLLDSALPGLLGGLVGGNKGAGLSDLLGAARKFF